MRDHLGTFQGETTAPDIALSVNGVQLRRKGQVLLDLEDLRITKGRRTVILGTNGAGKSLSLRVMHGLLKPDTGRVLVAGQPLDRMARRRQAMVFQKPVLLRRSVAGNLRFALSVYGLRGNARAQRLEALVEMAGLTRMADRPARHLSGGEQQRLALVRALASEPDILLLDEPTASLDPAATQAVETLILRAHEQGVTVVMVTHDAGQARRIGQDAVFLHQGRVVEHGPAAQVIGAPLSLPAQAWRDGRLYLDPHGNGAM